MLVRITIDVDGVVYEPEWSIEKGWLFEPGIYNHENTKAIHINWVDEIVQAIPIHFPGREFDMKISSVKTDKEK